MADDAPIATRLQMLIIGAATTVLTTGGSYISSHWGGATQDQVKESAAKLEEKLGAKIDLATAKIGDDIKKYVDEKVESTEDRLSKSRKKKRSNVEP